MKIFLSLLSSMTTMAKSSTLLIDSSIVPRYLLGLCYKILDSRSLFLVITLVKLSIIPKY